MFEEEDEEYLTDSNDGDSLHCIKCDRFVDSIDSKTRFCSICQSEEDINENGEIK